MAGDPRAATTTLAPGSEGDPTDSDELKDKVLDRLAESANVAQFASFGPGNEPVLRYARIHDAADVYASADIGRVINTLLERSIEQSVNVRSFQAGQPKSHDFIYGLESATDVESAVRRLAGDGLYTIVNETIDIHDGGVSGVVFADVLEVAPDDTPRAVEKPDVALLPRELGLRLLACVYGFAPVVPDDRSLRVEFSIHPLKRGYRHAHTIVWEEERYEPVILAPQVFWPNRLSRFLGDKVFGLLVADAIGLPVPATTAVTRRVAPFSFGQATGSGEVWLRTAPIEQVPGRYTTSRGWQDPFRLLGAEDPEGDAIASVLAQEGVDAQYSGAAASTAEGSLIVEGVAGSGERFMQGEMAPQSLPPEVDVDVLDAHTVATRHLGAARFEWVHDGARLWVVQLHSGATPGSGRTIYPGTPRTEHRFAVERGIGELRELVDRLRGTGEGVVLVGSAGVTSHLGDILRKSRIPSRMESLARFS